MSIGGVAPAGEFTVLEDRAFEADEFTVLAPDNFSARSFFGPRSVRRRSDEPESGRWHFTFRGDTEARFARIRVTLQDPNNPAARANISLNGALVVGEHDSVWDSGAPWFDSDVLPLLAENNTLDLEITSAAGSQVTFEVLGREIRRVFGPLTTADPMPGMFAADPSARMTFLRITSEGGTRDDPARADILLNGIPVVEDDDTAWVTRYDPEPPPFELAVSLETSNTVEIQKVSGDDIAVEVLATEPERREFTVPPATPRVFLLIRSDDARAHVAVNDTAVFDDEMVTGETAAEREITDWVLPGEDNTLEVVLTSPEGTGIRAEIIGRDVTGNTRTDFFPVLLPTGATASCEADGAGAPRSARSRQMGEAVLRVTPADSSATAAISVNGSQVVDETMFNGMETVEVPLALSGDTARIDVTVTGGTGVIVGVVGIDADDPTIAACVSPEPLADSVCVEQDGVVVPWHNNDVTVDFVCEDGTSAVEVCTESIVIQTEGREQQISGSAEDVAGNRAEASTLICLDKSGPSISNVTPGEVAPVFAPFVEIAGDIEETHSGISSVRCMTGGDGYDAQVEAGRFRCEVPLERGLLNVFLITATDRAGNRSFFSRTIDAKLPSLGGKDCTASIQNHVNWLNPKDESCKAESCRGTFAIPNVPADAGTYRVRVACRSAENQETAGASDFMLLVPGDNTQAGVIVMPPDIEVPQALEVVATPDELTIPGETSQLAVAGLLPNGEDPDLTLNAETGYGSSNPGIATVDGNGVVTAVLSGTALISARHQGVLGAVSITVSLGDDSDGDGLPDDYERAFGLDPGDPGDAGRDEDRDGLTALEEFELGTSPLDADTDGDGLTDLEERKSGTPAVIADGDRDGLDDGQELRLGTDPFVNDSDGDGLPDGTETALLLNPLLPDSDGDGVLDGDLDSDGDGLSNIDEVAVHHTRPDRADTDGDGLPDGVELALGEDPLLPETVVPLVALDLGIGAPTADDGSGETVVEGRTLHVRVHAEDNVEVASVALSVNDLLMTDAIPPYAFTFTVPRGLDELRCAATAVDVNGNVGTAEIPTLSVVSDSLTTVEGVVVDGYGLAVADGDVRIMLGGLTAEYFFSDGAPDTPVLPDGVTPDVVQRVSAINFLNPEGHFGDDTFGIGRDSDFFARFTGTIGIGSGGRYVFALGADDGAKLLIGDALVTEVARADRFAEASGSIDLAAGVYPIRIEYFQGGGHAELLLSMSFAGGESEVARPLILFQEVDDPAAPSSGSGWFSVDDVPTSLDKLRATGSGSVGVLPVEGASPETDPVPDDLTEVGTIVLRAIQPDEFRQIATGDRHACGLMNDGEVYCWGRGIEGQLGRNGLSVTPEPVHLPGGPAYVAIAAGGNRTCGLTEHGKAYCWGSIDALEIRNETPNPVAEGQFFSEISVGGDHTCGLNPQGLAFCWGANDAGQLGNGDLLPSGSPLPVSGGLFFASISAGDRHTCGVTTTGDTYCWGEGFDGQLGQGSTAASATPTLVGPGHAFAFASVEGAARHTCATTVNGAVHCWGAGDEGQLGAGATESSALPLAAAGRLGLRGLAGGGAHNCALSPVGVAYCWGRGAEGQLGLETAGSTATPTPQTMGPTFDALAAGERFTCALTKPGAVFCWGANESGQLGNGSTSPSHLPMRVYLSGSRPAHAANPDHEAVEERGDTGGSGSLAQ
jgi:alpha-tubulin suppressor-like RCC1 family protein